MHRPWPNRGTKDNDLALALTTIKVLAASFTELGAAFAVMNSKAAQKAIAAIDKGAVQVLRSLWGECASELQSVGDIGTQSFEKLAPWFGAGRLGRRSRMLMR